jgi:hypothetical protein
MNAFDWFFGALGGFALIKLALILGCTVQFLSGYC